MSNAIDMDEMEPVSRPLLPIFFILDTSGSMNGQPISVLNHTMEETINILGKFAASNSDALIKIGVLEFNSEVKWMQPKGLEELEHFVYNPLEAAGLTYMGEALNELDKQLSRKAFLASTTGRFAPIIIFMTDGQPNDDWETALKNISQNNRWYQHSIKIGLAVGSGANMEIISRIVGDSEAVIKTDDLNAFSILLKKIAINSAMIGSQSRLTGTPSGAEIVAKTIKESEESENVKTAGQMGIKVDPVPADPWGSDVWN